MRAGTILVGLVLAACGGAPPRSPRTNVAPPRDARGALPTVANRNAPPPDPVEGSGGAIALWCSQPNGVACAAAERTLGLRAAPAEAIAGELLAAARDTDDDCNDPAIAPLMQRVTSAVGAGSRWRDEDGPPVEPAAFGDRRRGGGCASVPAAAEPVVKIQAADAPEGVRFLVRVWEIGDVS